MALAMEHVFLCLILVTGVREALFYHLSGSGPFCSGTQERSLHPLHRRNRRRGEEKRQGQFRRAE